MRSQAVLVLGLAVALFSSVCRSEDVISLRTAAARKAVTADPKSAQARLDLASALYRQGRDADDPTVYKEAMASADRALVLSPGNFEALKMRVAILIGLDDFVGALSLAKELNQKVPDDIVVRGYLVDVHMALGDYEQAEKDAQWILDLRAGSTLGFIKAAALRGMFGDFEGASEFYQNALLRTPRGDGEEQARLSVLDAGVHMDSGDLKRSAELLDRAQHAAPESPFLASALARLKTLQNDFAGAVVLRKQIYEKTPTASNLFRLAEALARNGQTTEAASAFHEFETKARASDPNSDLVFYNADHAHRAAEALTIGSKQAAARHDSETLDAFAWALYRNGKFEDAWTQMEHALAPGVRKGEYFCHARQIARALKNDPAVTKFDKELLRLGGFQCDTSY